MAANRMIAELLNGQDLRAAAFIVTVYGDIVVPRGGILWTGSLIEICGLFGLSESVVRTAVSRLVAAQRLRGERIGRRSYYSLDASAGREFAEAAKLLYQPDIPAKGWQVVHAPDLTEAEARKLRMGQMAASVYIRPDRGQALPEGAQMLAASDPQDMGWIAGFWDLSSLQGRYHDLIDRFSPVLDKADSLSDESALAARLLLVHAYRGVLLRDPRLPAPALPADWQGREARDLFKALYLALSTKAGRWIAAHCERDDGPLPSGSDQLRAREEGLLSAY